jgi:PilZ domain-containing protein
MLDDEFTPPPDQATIDRRRDYRVAGPFDGFRVGALETPIVIFDLSRGGCFINSMHEQKPGIRFVIKIELPYVGQIRVKAETLYRRTGFGFAVRFVEMNEETANLLDQALSQLQDRAAYDE